MNRELQCIAVAGALLCAPARAQHENHVHQEAAGQAPAEASMQSAYGPYSMMRDASGTSWQPDATPMLGIQGMHGGWTTMLHGYANAVYDNQRGPRGDAKTFSESMLMGMAQRPLGAGTLGLRAMVSLDPLMGKSGYPLLFQTGESADGRNMLVDRQHPHDFFMELSASYSRPLADNLSAFGYIGLPGEPALGPPAFMHRASGADNPEAPLTHHWLDSTHITFGVVTLGAVWSRLKVEGSVFNGREPDQSRWNIETRALDSASARISYNPSANWAFQLSYGRLASPEQLEPNVAVRRTTVSAIYDTSIRNYRWQTTFAWGQNSKDPGNRTDAYLLESALRLGERHTLFARAEMVDKDELFAAGAPLAGQVFRVKKLSTGYVYDFAKVQHVRIGAGGVVSAYSYPATLAPAYGGAPYSYMVFLRARLD